MVFRYAWFWFMVVCCGLIPACTSTKHARFSRQLESGQRLAKPEQLTDQVTIVGWSYDYVGKRDMVVVVYYTDTIVGPTVLSRKLRDGDRFFNYTVVETRMSGDVVRDGQQGAEMAIRTVMQDNETRRKIVLEDVSGHKKVIRE